MRLVNKLPCYEALIQIDFIHSPPQYVVVQDEIDNSVFLGDFVQAWTEDLLSYFSIFGVKGIIRDDIESCTVVSKRKIGSFLVYDPAWWEVFSTREIRFEQEDC